LRHHSDYAAIAVLASKKLPHIKMMMVEGTENHNHLQNEIGCTGEAASHTITPATLANIVKFPQSVTLQPSKSQAKSLETNEHG